MFFFYRKSKNLLHQAYQVFQKSKKNLSSVEEKEILSQMQAFQDAILKKEKTKVIALWPAIKKIAKDKSKIPYIIRAKDFTFGLLIAIAIAFGLIRPMWFEIYQIPTGSMRPTLKELDRLTVSKCQFGINIPFTPKQFYFDENEILRNGITIFTGEGLNIADGKTDYFYLFRGYKLYIKRLIGKPLDTLYFYGGRIYGIDKDGNSITRDLNPEYLRNINHIPFLNFEGQVKPKGKTPQGILSPVVFYQSGLPVLKMQSYGPFIQSEILYSNGKPIADYYELFGIGNYGVSRIIKKDRYYLEILHHPSIKGAKLQQDYLGRYLPTLNTNKSYLALDSTHLKTIFENLYTARFVVKNGMMRRISQNSPPLEEASSSVYPKFQGIPDGTYEYYYGKAYQITTQGMTKELPSNHPLNQFSEEKAVFFYNYGIEFDLIFAPDSPYKIFPSRYAYYSFDDLYLMGAKIFDKEDPMLKEFVQEELSRKEKNKEFLPFIDQRPPFNCAGDIKKDFIEQYGLKIPEKSYYLLGDNHAMSADSRRFGFVPEGNIRGVADFIFWPFGNRFGHPLQPIYPLFTKSRLIIWALAIIGYLAYVVYHRKKGKFPYRF